MRRGINASTGAHTKRAGNANMVSKQPPATTFPHSSHVWAVPTAGARTVMMPSVVVTSFRAVPVCRRDRGLRTAQPAVEVTGVGAAVRGPHDAPAHPLGVQHTAAQTRH